MRASIPSPDGSGTDPYWSYPRFGEASDEEGCYVDGIQTSCSTAVNIITSGAGIQCPYSSCGPVYNQRDVNGDGRIDSYWDVFRAHADGSSGYMAMGGIYSGGGRFHMPGTGQRARPQFSAPSSNRNSFGAGSDPEGDNRLSNSNVLPPDNRVGLLVYFSAEGNIEKKIQDIIDFAIKSEECTKAFKAAGATPIKDQLKSTTVITQNVFNDSRNDSLWTGGTNIGQQMRDGLQANKTTNDLATPGLFGDTGRRFIGLTDRAIEGKDDYFSVVLIHSLVHTGGKERQDSQTWEEWFWGINPHDLRYLGEKYKDILKHCTKEGRSKGIGQ
ncbi:MAG: hypothetical protein H0U45_13610 [Tatlockia sp.]|nr:hypothetical protein [Tatlockia sp.]